MMGWGGGGWGLGGCVSLLAEPKESCGARRDMKGLLAPPMAALAAQAVNQTTL